MLSNARQQHLNETQLENTTLDSPDLQQPQHQHQLPRQQQYDHRARLEQTPLIQHNNQHQQQPTLQSQANLDSRLQEMTQDMQPHPDLSANQMLLFSQQLQNYNMNHHQPVHVAQGYAHLDIKSDPNDTMSAHPGMEQVAHHLAQTQEGAPLPRDIYDFAPLQGTTPHV